MTSTGYETRTETVSACGLDLQQYDDPEGLAALAGISTECWPLFGVVWPSARVCDLALASLVLHRRAGDVTASDCHPLVPLFLSRNLVLNAMGVMPYCAANWARGDATMGRFDLIIGSDVLYERGHAGELSRFLDAHVEADGRVMLVDPNRSQRTQFNRDMEGFGLQWSPVEAAPGLDARYRGRLLNDAR